MVGEINQEQVREVFIAYTDGYNSDDEKIILKIEHTYRVAELSMKIAQNLEMLTKDVKLAWLIGMLHDIGRFEQIRRYGTFEDAKSVSHAKLGVEILFDDGVLGEFSQLDCNDKEVLQKAILYHSDYKMPADLSDRELLFCNIIRDADKIDILKVVYESSPEVIYGVSEELLKKEDISDDVMKCFDERNAVFRPLRKSHIDNIVGYASFVYELVYAESRRLCDEQGYIWKILDFNSEHADVNNKMTYMKEQLVRFLKE